jgi:thioesterase domain-containing protein
LVHPVGGNVVCYQQLAELLPEFSVFGLQARESAAPLSIEQMAAHYVRELIARQLPQPWFLGGWSMGGIIAAEMSAQLAQQQRDVSAVLLLDSLLPPTGLDADEPWLVQRFLADLGAPTDLCRSAQARAATGTAIQALEQALPHLPVGDIGVTRIAELFQLFARNQRALLRHAPRAVPSQLLLLRAEQPLFEGWRDPAPLLTTPGMDLRERSIDATHFTLLTQPAVTHVAAALRSFLAPFADSP